MRILLVATLLLATAACAWQPPATTPAPPAGRQPAALAPAPAPVPAPAPQASLWLPQLPLPFLHLYAAHPGRLTLSNYTFDSVHIRMLVTGYPDCVPRPGTATGEFELPLNGTRVIATPPGADVCWRREGPDVPAGWNRAFTAAGRTIDARL